MTASYNCNTVIHESRIGLMAHDRLPPIQPYISVFMQSLFSFHRWPIWVSSSPVLYQAI